MTHPKWLDPTHKGSDEQSDRLLSEKEVRHRLNVSRNFLAQLVQDKELTAIKIRRLWRFRREDVERYLAERENTREA